jgi:hypothetical protein
MRKLLLVAAIVASATAANAQATFGVKGGLNLSSLKSSGDGESETTDTKTGFNVGAFANVPLGTTFSFAPELVLSTEGGKESETFMGEKYEAKYNLTYLNIPLLLQYNASGFVAHTGPQVGFLMSAKSKVKIMDEEEEIDMKDEMEKINLSWAVGLGYQLPGGLGFNARYNLGLSDLSKESGEGKLKANTIQIGVSYSFGGGSSKK